jgi:hypothetical protein
MRLSKKQFFFFLGNVRRIRDGWFSTLDSKKDESSVYIIYKHLRPEELLNCKFRN